WWILSRKARAVPAVSATPACVDPRGLGDDGSKTPTQALHRAAAPVAAAGRGGDAAGCRVAGLDRLAAGPRRRPRAGARAFARPGRAVHRAHAVAAAAEARRAAGLRGRAGGPRGG